MAVQYKLAMAGFSGTSKPPRSIKLLCFLLRSSLAALLLTPCLSGAPIDSALVPEGCFLLAICANRPSHITRAEKRRKSSQNYKLLGIL
jgi:hypothetical protein